MELLLITKYEYVKKKMGRKKKRENDSSFILYKLVSVFGECSILFQPDVSVCVAVFIETMQVH